MRYISCMKYGSFHSVFFISLYREDTKGETEIEEEENRNRETNKWRQRKDKNEVNNFICIHFKLVVLLSYRINGTFLGKSFHLFDMWCGWVAMILYIKVKFDEYSTAFTANPIEMKRSLYALFPCIFRFTHTIPAIATMPTDYKHKKSRSEIYIRWVCLVVWIHTSPFTWRVWICARVNDKSFTYLLDMIVCVCMPKSHSHIQ